MLVKERVNRCVDGGRNKEKGSGKRRMMKCLKREERNSW